MLSRSQVEDQLKQAKCHFRFWGRGEMHALRSVLLPDEVIDHCVNGYYEGGFAMLLVTNQRLLLVDHKPLFLSVEDVRFDMIAEVDYRAQLITSTAKIQTPARKLIFTTWSHYHLRIVLDRVQDHMQALRQQYIDQAQFMAGFQTALHETARVLLGGMVTPAGGAHRPLILPSNPYTKNPLVVRHKRKFPRFG